MSLLSAEQILKSEDTEAPQLVSVPEWGGEVFIRVMSGAERDRWELMAHKALKGNSPLGIRATLVAFCACDQNGKRIFADGQIAALANKSAVALDRVFHKAQRLNKLTDDDIKELEGNSKAGPVALSGTA